MPHGKFSVLLILLAKIASCIRNPMTYFKFDLIQNYDVLICQDLPKNVSSIVSPALTIKVVNFPELNENTILLMLPRNASEFYRSTSELFQRFQGSDEVGDNGFIFIFWPERLRPKYSSNIHTVLGKMNYSSSSLGINTNIFIIFRISYWLFSLWEIYGIKDQRFSKSVGLFSGSIGIEDVLPKAARRTDFQGVEIVAIATAEAGYEDESKYSNETGIPQLESGFAVRLYRDLKDVLNFSESALNGDWMYIENNTLKGSQGEALISSEADICISQNVMRSDIAQFLTFLQPTSPLSVIAFFKEPTLGNLKEIYNAPFDIYVWFLLFLLALLIPAMVYLFIRVLHFKKSSASKTILNIQIQSESIIWMIGTSAQQGWHIFPNVLPLKILFITGSISAYVVYGFYSAALVSKLSVQRSPIQSFKDLLNYDYAFTFNIKSVSLREYTKGMKSYYEIPNINGYKGESLRKSVMTRQTVLLSYWEGIQGIYPVPNELQYICNSLQAFPVENTRVNTGVTLKKGSPYREIFNQKILQLKERGLNDRYEEHYIWATQPQCLEKSSIRHERLSLRSILSAHLILLIGLCTALVCLFIERQLFRKRKMSIDSLLEFSYSGEYFKRFGFFK